jgi:hypothetical protein
LTELQELKTGLDYAYWAFESSYVEICNNCRKAGLDLMRHDTATEPGRVGHFIPFDCKNKTAIVALKGISTLADALAYLMAVPKQHCSCFDDKAFPAPLARICIVTRAFILQLCGWQMICMILLKM